MPVAQSETANFRGENEHLDRKKTPQAETFLSETVFTDTVTKSGGRSIQNHLDPSNSIATGFGGTGLPLFHVGAA